MPYNISINSTLIKEWITANLSIQDIEADLHRKGFDLDSIKHHLSEFKKQQNAKRQFKGFVYMSVGAFIGFISFVLTVSEIFPQWYGFILYGLTSIAITLAFVGMYFVLEG